MVKEIENERRVKEMELNDRIHAVREDLKGDALLSAELVKAAFGNRWQEVERLLNLGADPRICRRGDAFGMESALFYALREQQFDIARKLYAAGDRLEDLIVEDEGNIPVEALNFIAGEMRCGRNWFYDETRTLSECCRCSAFTRINDMIETASQDELNKSVAPVIHSWCRNFQTTDLHADILEKLIRRGARISEQEKSELLSDISRRFGHCPAILHPGKDQVEKITAILQKI